MSLIDRVKNQVVKPIQSKVAELKSSEPGKLATQAAKSVMPGVNAFKFAKDGFDQVKGGLKSAQGILNKDSLDTIENATSKKFNLPAKAGVKFALAGAGGKVLAAGKDALTAAGDIRNAVRTGSKDDIIHAAASTGNAVSSALSTVGGGLQGSHVTGGLLKAGIVQQKLQGVKAASEAFAAAVPNASAAVTKAADQALHSASFTKGADAVKAASTAAADAAKSAPTTFAKAITGEAGRNAAEAALKSGEKGAAEALVKTGAKTLGKAAGRFAPGLNIAIAAADTATAAATIADPKASVGKKITSGITAVGSIAAATNIPVVSQVGAAVSVVSDIVGGFFS